MARKSTQGARLVPIIKEHKLKRIIEVGVWKGTTTRHILREVNDEIECYWAIDLWEVMGEEHLKMSELTKEDWDDKYKRVCLDMYYFSSLRVARLSSIETATLFPNGYFDMVFIDANHFYDDVLEDIKTWLPKVRKGGFLTGHDYNRGYGKGHRVKEAVDEYFGEGVVELYGSSVWGYKVK